MGILVERRTVLTGALCAAASSLTRVSAAAGPLVVVAHEDVPHSSFSKNELAAIFTTRRRNYDGGGRIVPLNLPPKQAQRVAFDQSVLGMSPEDVARYWIDRRVRGGNSPPRHVPSAGLAKKLIERLPGSISYLPESLAGGMNVVARL